MTSCVKRFRWRYVLGALAAALLAAALPGVASAQAPPAAVDQYKPAPPGDPSPDPDRPGRDDGGGGPSGGAPDGSTPTGASPGIAGPAPGEAPASAPEGGAAGAGGSDDPGDSAAARGGTGRDGDAGGGPVVAGFPLTWPLIAAIALIAIGVCAGLGLAAWRRHRAAAPLAEAG